MYAKLHFIFEIRINFFIFLSVKLILYFVDEYIYIIIQKKIVTLPYEKYLLYQIKQKNESICITHLLHLVCLDSDASTGEIPVSKSKTNVSGTCRKPTLTAHA